MDAFLFGGPRDGLVAPLLLVGYDEGLVEQFAAHLGEALRPALPPRLVVRHRDRLLGAEIDHSLIDINESYSFGVGWDSPLQSLPQVFPFVEIILIPPASPFVPL